MTKVVECNDFVRYVYSDFIVYYSKFLGVWKFLVRFSNGGYFSCFKEYSSKEVAFRAARKWMRDNQELIYASK